MAIANALYNFMYINLETDVCLDQAFSLLFFFSLFFLSFSLFIKTVIFCIALSVLNLTLYTKLSLNSEICMPLLPKCCN